MFTKSSIFRTIWSVSRFCFCTKTVFQSRKRSSCQLVRSIADNSQECFGRLLCVVLVFRNLYTHAFNVNDICNIIVPPRDVVNFGWWQEIKKLGEKTEESRFQLEMGDRKEWQLREMRDSFRNKSNGSKGETIVWLEKSLSGRRRPPGTWQTGRSVNTTAN